MLAAQGKTMLSSRKIIQMLKAEGWYHVGTEGDHYHFRHPERPGKVTVPHPEKDLCIELVKSIERQSGVRLHRRG